MVDNSTVKSITIDFKYKHPFETHEDYQQCFLSVFGIEEFNESIIAEKTKALYEELKDNKDFVDLLKHLAGQMMSDDPEIGLYLLFSYSYIHDFLEILRSNKNSGNYNFTNLISLVR